MIKLHYSLKDVIQVKGNYLQIIASEPVKKGRGS